MVCSCADRGQVRSFDGALAGPRLCRSGLARVLSTFLAFLTFLTLLACAGTISQDAPGGQSSGGAGPGATGGATGTAGTKAGRPEEIVAPVLVRRLSQDELDNTLADVLGDDTRPARRLLIEDEFRPYDNDYALQRASAAYTDAVRELARAVGQRAVSTPQTRAAFLRCQPTGPGDTACFRQTIATLGRRMLRRPLTAAEVDAYAGLQKFATEANAVVKPDFFTAVDLLIRAFVQDPEFFHRVEGGKATSTPGVFALDGAEIASRLSYLLWGSAPDEPLLEAAAGDRLLTPAGRGAELERMLKAPRARTRLHRFHSMWLGYRAIPHPPALTAQFNDETTALIDQVVFDAMVPYTDLFTSNRTFLSAELARHYGLPSPAGGKGWVTYPNTGGADRAGILSHGAVLAAFSKFSDTSPTQRGIFVQTRLLCREIADPPANVDVDQPPGNPDKDCKTDRYRAHMDQSGCRSCHGLIDPVGFGLERYDVAGRYRENDDGKPNCKIPGEGELPGLGKFSGPRALGRALIDSGTLSSCAVEQFLSFALGRPVEASEAPLVPWLRKAMADDGERFVAILRQLVTAPSFALRREVKP